MSAFLQIEQLCVGYPGQSQAAVDGISLHLAAGEIGVLIGASGCGKTTLLRAVAGLLRVQGGTITLADEAVSSSQHHVPVEKRQIGMVFQDYALFPHLSVEGNIRLGLHQWDKPARAVRVLEMLALVGLESFAQRFPHELSGGQQQRVALARALAPRPRLLLLDEPFSNLDGDLRERLAHEVRDILKTTQTTALFVTHDQLEAFTVADVIGVMRDGQLHQWSDAYTLYHRPATRFVAEFIGQGVFTPAQVQTQGDAVQVQTPLGTLRNVQTWPPSNTAGQYDALLRAEHIVLDAHAPLKAQLVRKAFRGATFLYTLQLATGETVLAQVPASARHTLGEWLGIRPHLDCLLTYAR